MLNILLVISKGIIKIRSTEAVIKKVGIRVELDDRDESMSKKVRNFLIGVVMFLLVVAVGGNLFYKNWIQTNIPLSFPQVDGKITIEGLDAPVEVYRDEMGIPHIYASTLYTVKV